jgi:hypothetical protein
LAGHRVHRLAGALRSGLVLAPKMLPTASPRNGLCSPRKGPSHSFDGSTPGSFDSFSIGHGKYAKKKKNWVAIIAFGIAVLIVIATLAITHIHKQTIEEQKQEPVDNGDDNVQFPFALYVCFPDDKRAHGRYEIVGGSRNSPAYMNTSPISNFTLYKHAEQEDSFVRWYITDVRSLTKYVHRYKSMNPSVYPMGQTFQKVRHEINIEEDAGLKIQEGPCVARATSGSL